MGPIAVNEIDWTIVNDNPFFCPDPNCIAPMEALIDELRRAGDSVGARINVIAEGVMPGLGEPVFDRLDAELAKAMMSINAVKGLKLEMVSQSWSSGDPSTETRFVRRAFFQITQGAY